MEPQALQIIETQPDDTILLNEEALRNILTQDEIRDRYVAVISITGAFRGGKSFLLNFLLRYLKIKYLEKRNVTDWLTPEDGPLKGFSWAAGSKRHTSGIMMWPQVFLTTLPTEEKVAIFLLDTQGSFDNQTTMDDCAKIFALSTLISSVQIYNVMRTIRQYDLTHIQCFGGFGNLLTNGESAPFQNFTFLVRDWACPYEHPYGDIGGAAMLEQIFSSKNPEIQEQVINIKSLFNETNCFLMPYPGRTVDASNTFNGSLDDIDESFLDNVSDFVTLLLSPENLVLKTVNGVKLKAEDFMCYITEYCNILKDGDLPKMETIFKATIEAHHKAALMQALKIYKKNMDVDVKYSPRSSNETELFKKHTTNKIKTIDYYTKIKKMGDPHIFDKYLIRLKNEVETEHKRYRVLNDERKRKLEQTKKRMEEAQRMAGARASSSGLSQLNTAEKVGIAASVIGGVAVLAFGASKLFSSSRGNND
ncbi:atlastin-like [Zophobas morio]|uniref:atlastin-like n=1 Tax=Zophobas morio TaxID=2755281 RepID=UPI0030828806